MEGIRILVIFLTLVLLTPVITSPFFIGKGIDGFELCENLKENEKRENRDSDKKDELDKSEKFLVHHLNSTTFLSTSCANFHGNGMGMLNFSCDVLTPPPKST